MESCAELIFGHSSTEAVGQSIRLIVPPALQDEDDEIQRRFKAGQSLDRYETVRVRKDGQRIDVSLTISPLATAGGKIVGASKIVRVITRRKRLETSFGEGRRLLSSTTIPSSSN